MGLERGHCHRLDFVIRFHMRRSSAYCGRYRGDGNGCQRSGRSEAKGGAQGFGDWERQRDHVEYERSVYVSGFELRYVRNHGDRVRFSDQRSGERDGGSQQDDECVRHFAGGPADAERDRGIVGDPALRDHVATFFRFEGVQRDQ